MKTSSKLRRLQRMRKLRRQRRAFFLVMMVFFIMIAHSAFSQNDKNDTSYSVVSVTVQPGDTLWSIAREYKPEGTDLRSFVYELADNNGLSDCSIVCGQSIFVPVIAD